MTSTGFLATVKEMIALEEGPVHLVQMSGIGIEMGASSWRAPEKRGRRGPGSGKES